MIYWEHTGRKVHAACLELGITDEELFALAEKELGVISRDDDGEELNPADIMMHVFSVGDESLPPDEKHSFIITPGTAEGTLRVDVAVFLSYPIEEEDHPFYGKTIRFPVPDKDEEEEDLN